MPSIDPVLRDLNRHLRETDRAEAQAEHEEALHDEAYREYLDQAHAHDPWTLEDLWGRAPEGETNLVVLTRMILDTPEPHDLEGFANSAATLVALKSMVEKTLEAAAREWAEASVADAKALQGTNA